MMGLPRPIIHLLGAASVLIFVAVGVGFGLPLWNSARTADEQAHQIVTTNGLQQSEVDRLTEESVRMSELAAEVEALKAQIPQFAARDRAVQLIADAASASGVRLINVSSGEEEGFAVRSAEIVAAELGGVTTPAEASAQRQLAITVRVTAPGTDEAAAFLDALRNGPRLVGVTSAEAVPNLDRTEVDMTANVLVYFDTTGAQG